MRLVIPARHIPLLATVAAAAALYTAACAMYDGFFSLRVFVNFLGDNSFLGIIAVGMTFVIISGGIDLSVGSVSALCGIVMAVMMQEAHVPPVVAIAAGLAVGSALGFLMGLVIRLFDSPPFIVTLGGMFLARGLAFVIRLESLPIRNRFYDVVSGMGIGLPGGVRLPITAVIYLAVVAVGMYIASCTPFGRNVYAVGGDEEAAHLMGLPVGRTKVAVYTLSGFCSALAAVVVSFYQSAGNPAGGVGWELDAIAAVVIGGTLLSGGVGHVAGTFLGVLIFAIIQTAITFQGTLSSWWTKVAIGLLLLVFILLQKVIGSTAGPRRGMRGLG